MSNIKDIAWFCLWPGLLILLLVMGIGLGSVARYKNIRSDGRVEYCYIDTTTGGGLPYYSLYGYRTWSYDRKFSNYYSFDEAVNAAKELNCPLNK